MKHFLNYFHTLYVSSYLSLIFFVILQVEATDDISKLPVGPPPDFELMNVTKIDW